MTARIKKQSEKKPRALQIVGAQKPRLPVLTLALADRINLHVGCKLKGSVKLTDLKDRKNKAWNAAMSTIEYKEVRAIRRALTTWIDLVPAVNVGDIRYRTRWLDVSTSFLVLAFDATTYGKKKRKKK